MNIDLKCDLNQEVYVINNNKISKNIVEKIRITKYKPFKELVSKGKIIDREGIKIEYLIIQNNKFDWYEEDDIYLTKEDLIRAIE